MSILYAIFIYPLEIFYQWLYIFFSSVTGSFGWSLICLSVVSTIIYTPLKDLAAKVQAKERKIQSVLGPQIKAISSQSRGAERHGRIKGLYARYAYHPLYGLRSMFGVLLQVPFLIAAYNMLVSYPAIAGQGFGPITDLSRPDGLLFGLNILPLLMTVFNLGALYTTRSFAFKEHVQGLIIAVLFLALLYAAPSALLIYWTANNAWLFFLNLRAALRKAPPKTRTWRLAEAIEEFKRQNSANLERGRQKAAKGTEYGLAGLLGISLLILIPMLLRFLREDWLNMIAQIGGEAGWAVFLPDVIILSFVLMIFLLLAIWSIKNSARRDLIKVTAALILLWLSLTAAFAATTIVRNWGAVTFDNLAFGWLYLTIILAALITCHFSGRSPVKTNLDLDVFNGQNGSVYLASVLVFGLLAFLFVPSALYNSSPGLLFPYTYSDLLAQQLPLLSTWLLLSGLLWLMIPASIKAGPAVLAVIICLGAVFNALVFTADYGPMRGTLFIGGGARFGPNWLNFIKDFGTLVLVGFILLIQFRFRRTQMLIRALHVIGLSFIVFGWYCWASEVEISAGDDPAAASGQERFLYSFSATQPNVIVIILDSFDNSHLKLIFSRHPDLKARFSGFVAYTDVVAAGSSTILSMPSVYGGHDFTPQAINQGPDDIPRLEKIAEALAFLPRIFTDNGYKASMVGQSFAVYYSQVQKKLARPELFEGFEQLPAPTLARWQEHIGWSGKDSETDSIDYAGFFAVFSAFRLAPFFFKEQIYDQGDWLGLAGSYEETAKRIVLQDSAVLGLWPLLGRLDSAGPTFKIAMSNLTHALWYLGPDSLIPISPGQIRPSEEDSELPFNDDLEYKQYCSERHALKLLADFFDWLKSSGIYDNSRIVLVSDHNDLNWSFIKPELRDALKRGDGPLPNIGSRIDGDRMYIIRPAAILMVKDFGATETFRYSEALMSTADMPSIACEGLAECPAQAFGGPDRVRTHVAGPWRGAEHPERKYTFKEYTIRGEMNKIDNWTW